MKIINKAFFIIILCNIYSASAKKIFNMAAATYKPISTVSPVSKPDTKPYKDLRDEIIAMNKDLIFELFEYDKIDQKKLGLFAKDFSTYLWNMNEKIRIAQTTLYPSKLTFFKKEFINQIKNEVKENAFQVVHFKLLLQTARDQHMPLGKEDIDTLYILRFIDMQIQEAVENWNL